MKHHLADLLDRTADYSTTIPNREIFAFVANFKIPNKEDVKILTITKNQEKEHWTQVFNCPNLEELTLHDPSDEQVKALSKLKYIKRLRITFLRTKDIAFISNLVNLEELVLEYVSGFTNLAPLSKLTKLKSLHCENHRKVSNFDGLRGLKSLQYLHINGTLDWNQPVDNFSYLEEIENLEVLVLGWIANRTDYPSLMPLLRMKKLKKFMAGMSTLSTKEFAFIEVALPYTFCCNFSGEKIEKYFITEEKMVYFLGKGTRSIKLNDKNFEEKMRTFERKYEEYKEEARKVISGSCG